MRLRGGEEDGGESEEGGCTYPDNVYNKGMVKRRKKGESLERKKCFIEDCEVMQRNKGKYKDIRTYGRYCEFHHRHKYPYNNPNSVYTRFVERRNIDNAVCSRCGWDKAPCDRHRIDSKSGYLPDNVIILCPNCHREGDYKGLRHESNRR